jgi:hypothetical protein
MTPQEQANADLILTILRTIDRRDRGLLQKLYHPEIEFHWQPGLPYGGFFTGATVPKMQERFASIWFPLQPTNPTIYLSWHPNYRDPRRPKRMSYPGHEADLTVLSLHGRC